jgi:hypothetical protein
VNDLPFASPGNAVDNAQEHTAEVEIKGQQVGHHHCQERPGAKLPQARQAHQQDDHWRAQAHKSNGVEERGPRQQCARRIMRDHRLREIHGNKHSRRNPQEENQERHTSSASASQALPPWARAKLARLRSGHGHRKQQTGHRGRTSRDGGYFCREDQADHNMQSQDGDRDQVVGPME